MITDLDSLLTLLRDITPDFPRDIGSMIYKYLYSNIYGQRIINKYLEKYNLNWIDEKKIKRLRSGIEEIITIKFGNSCDELICKMMAAMSKNYLGGDDEMWWEDIRYENKSLICKEDVIYISPVEYLELLLQCTSRQARLIMDIIHKIQSFKYCPVEGRPTYEQIKTRIFLVKKRQRHAEKVMMTFPQIIEDILENSINYDIIDLPEPDTPLINFQ